MRYESSHLRGYADDLHGRAAWAEWLYPLGWAFGGLLGGAVGVASPVLMGAMSDGTAVLIVGVVATIMLFVGVWRGNSRALELRLAAQLALCQAEIEEHLSAMVPHSAPSASRQFR